MNITENLSIVVNPVIVYWLFSFAMEASSNFHLHFVDYYYIILLWIFQAFLLILVLYAKNRLLKFRRNLKSKPDNDYVRTRIFANQALDKCFLEIESLAKDALDLNLSATHTRIDKNSYQGLVVIDRITRMFEKLALKVDTTIANKSIYYIIESNGAQIMLMEKLDCLYESLMKRSPNENHVNASIRFEIKQRCLKSPFDINDYAFQR